MRSSSESILHLRREHQTSTTVLSLVPDHLTLDLEGDKIGTRIIYALYIFDRHPSSAMLAGPFVFLQGSSEWT